MRKILFILSFMICASLNAQESEITNMDPGSWGAITNMDPGGSLDALLDSVQNWIWVSSDNQTGTETGTMIYPYNTIQEGLDAATLGMVVVVLKPLDDTTLYREHLVMETAGVRLMSLEGQTVAIDLQSADGMGLDLGANEITIGGGSGMGFTFTCDAGLGLVMDANRLDVEISHNIIFPADESIGVNIGAAGATRLRMHHNEFRVSFNEGAFYAVKTLIDCDISYNEFIALEAGAGYAIQMTGFLNGIIHNNYIHSDTTGSGTFNSGIFPHTNTSDSHASDSLRIFDNIVMDCANGIRLGHANNSDMKDIFIYDNIIQFCDDGVEVYNDAQVFPRTYYITNNIFKDNTTDINNDNSTTANYQVNYFDGIPGWPVGHNTVYVSADNTTGTELGTFNFPYNTIQEGLTAANNGDVVVVLETSDGSSYDEHLVMDSANVRLMTLEGQTVEIVLQSSGGSGLDLGANGIIVGGGSGMGFTISQDAGLMIVMDADRSDVEVSYNEIIVDNGGTIGVNIGASGATRFKMKNNLFLVDSAMGGFFAVKSLDDVEIIDNEFQGADTSSSYAIQFSGFLNGIIAGNYIHRGANVAGGFASGIFPHTNTAGSHSSDSLEIYNNIVQDCSNGIRLGHANGADMKEIYVYGNILQHNSKGIFVHNDAQVYPATYDVYNNTFSDNATNIVNDHATGLNIGLNTFEEKVIVGYLATSNTTVVTPTATGELDSLETSDITEITLDTLNVNYITVNGFLFYQARGAMTYVSTPGTQTIGTGGTFERLNEGAIAYTAAHMNSWTHDDGRLTYTGTETQHFIIHVNVTIEGDEVAQLIRIQLAKGGSPIAGTNMQEDYTAVDTDDSMGFTWIEEMATDEFLEVFGTSDTNGDTFEVHNITFTVTQQ